MIVWVKAHKFAELVPVGRIGQGIRKAPEAGHSATRLEKDVVPNDLIQIRESQENSTAKICFTKKCSKMYWAKLRPQDEAKTNLFHIISGSSWIAQGMIQEQLLCQPITCHMYLGSIQMIRKLQGYRPEKLRG